MSLSSKLAFEFPRGVQLRGQELFTQGRVRASDIEPNHFHGSVQGGRLYEVCLQYTHKGYLTVSCGCPHFEDMGACKHLWAAVLEADRRGALSATNEMRYLRLEEVDLEAASPMQPFRLTSPPRPKPQPPAWETELGAIQRSME